MTNTVVDTAVQTAAAILPAVLTAGAAANPEVAGVVALAPIALQLLQSATQLQNAGAMTSDQLATLFLTIGQGVQSTHNQWAAMNAATVKLVATA